MLVPRTPRAFLAALALASAPGLACGGEDTAREPSLPAKLTWAPPPLAPGYDTIAVRPAGTYSPGHPPDRDCLVRMPARPVEWLLVEGCRNVRLIGGRVIRTDPLRGAEENAGIFLNGYSGTAHIEGVELSGSGLSDGIWASSARAGAVLQVQNVRVNEVHARVEYPRNRHRGGWPGVQHPDCLQLWQGPRVVRLDGFTCTTTAQGINVSTTDRGIRHQARSIDLRRTDVTLTRTGRQCYVAFGPLRAPAPTRLENAWCDPRGVPFDLVAYPAPVSADPAWWGKAARGGPFRLGTPPEGDFVPPGRAGIAYRSPGYIG